MEPPSPNYTRKKIPTHENTKIQLITETRAHRTANTTIKIGIWRHARTDKSTTQKNKSKEKRAKSKYARRHKPASDVRAKVAKFVSFAVFFCGRASRSELRDKTTSGRSTWCRMHAHDQMRGLLGLHSLFSFRPWYFLRRRVQDSPSSFNVEHKRLLPRSSYGHESPIAKCQTMFLH